ncbi:MAG: NAD-dependent epimerase/dehydratase family protein [Flavobacteriales bacterium]|jgi:dihydroflavonol-4-reductase|nr:NAD-dependent epimerase/dehydratase family protein [Flavobacteriales bacterium]
MILVTGGTGLVGSHLLYQLLLKGKKVRAIYRKNSDLERVKTVFSYYTKTPDIYFDKIEWLEADLNNIPDLEKAFENVKIVYHSAALISFDTKDYIKMRKTNIKGTTNIVNLCIDNKVKKLCYVSSIATLEDAPNGAKVTESNEWSGNKKSGYAITKYGAEQEVWRGSQEDLNVVIVNPGVIIGPGFWHSGSGQMYKNIAKGLKFYATGVTGFVGVTDVAKAMIALTESDISLERYILVSENLNFKQVFDLIADALHVKKSTIKITKFIGAIGWRLDWVRSLLTGKSALFTKQSAKSLHQKTYYDSDKIINALNFKFKKIIDVVKETAEVYKQ